MHEPSYKSFHILVKAKFMCLSYVMYAIQSYESKDTKIICILSDYGMEKRQYYSRGVHDISLDEKKCYSRLVHMM